MNFGWSVDASQIRHNKKKTQFRCGQPRQPHRVRYEHIDMLKQKQRKLSRKDPHHVHSSTSRRHDAVSRCLTILVESIVVDNHCHGRGTIGPVQLALVFVLDDRSLELHSVARAVGPRVLDSMGSEGMLHEGVVGSVDIDVGLESKNVI